MLQSTKVEKKGPRSKKKSKIFEPVLSDFFTLSGSNIITYRRSLLDTLDRDITTRVTTPLLAKTTLCIDLCPQEPQNLTFT